MSTATETSTASTITKLQLSTADGTVTRDILQTPLRDALSSEIPIIDVSPMFSLSLDDRKAVAQKIHDAATNTGFFYISNHGIPADLIEDVHRASLTFFHQDLDKKMQSDATQSKFSNGYRGPDTQMVNPKEGIDIRETFTWLYDPRYDPSVESLGDIPERVWEFMSFDDVPWETTMHLPELKSSHIAYYRAMLSLCHVLTRTFALSLSLSENYFDAKVQYPEVNLAVNYYPPFHDSKQPADPDAAVSIGSHTDFPLFTVLWQDQVGGLQVLSKEGQWLRAPPIEGTFVVNIADFMQRVTNDVYVSTVHRVQNWSGQERMSIPFFWGLAPNESCGVVETCVGEDGVKKYEEITCYEWTEKRMYSMLNFEREAKVSEG